MVFYETPDDPDTFERHYRDVHCPLVRALPDLRHFRVSRNVKDPRGGDRFYRVAELEWDTAQAMKDSFASPVGKELAADTAILVPPGKATNVIVEVQDAR